MWTACEHEAHLRLLRRFSHDRHADFRHAVPSAALICSPFRPSDFRSSHCCLALPILMPVIALLYNGISCFGAISRDAWGMRHVRAAGDPPRRRARRAFLQAAAHAVLFYLPGIIVRRTASRCSCCCCLLPTFFEADKRMLHDIVTRFDRVAPAVWDDRKITNELWSATSLVSFLPIAVGASSFR